MTTGDISASTKAPAIDPRRLRKPGISRPITDEEMSSRIALFDQLKPDPAAYPDLKDSAHKREVFWIISKDGLAGLPSPIRAPHNFHLSIMNMTKGKRPSTHAHPYNEIFVPLDSTFRFYWGDNEEKSVDLGPYSVISIPAGVMRTFESLEEKVAKLLVIQDTAGDPHADMLIAPRDYEKYYKDGWVPGVAPKD